MTWKDDFIVLVAADGVPVCFRAANLMMQLSAKSMTLYGMDLPTIMAFRHEADRRNAPTQLTPEIVREVFSRDALKVEAFTTFGHLNLSHGLGRGHMKDAGMRLPDGTEIKWGNGDVGLFDRWCEDVKATWKAGRKWQQEVRS